MFYLFFCCLNFNTEVIIMIKTYTLTFRYFFLFEIKNTITPSTTTTTMKNKTKIKCYYYYYYFLLQICLTFKNLFFVLFRVILVIKFNFWFKELLGELFVFNCRFIFVVAKVIIIIKLINKYYMTLNILFGTYWWIFWWFMDIFLRNIK